MVGEDIEKLNLGDIVIIETYRGIEVGLVKSKIHDLTLDELTSTMGKVLRVATQEDLNQIQKNTQKEKEAAEITRKKIEAHRLPMKLVDCEILFDGKKIVFYFTAEGRVDFRKLVRELASTFRRRVELFQIGVRDELKIWGGIGICGQQLCCKRFISQFSPVSIKMAKEQNLVLNPTMISGVCGRLMCCLQYEYAVYQELKKNLPSIGDLVEVGESKGKVVGLNILRSKVIVELEENQVNIEVKPEELKILK